jgi:hypothetical protein
LTINGKFFALLVRGLLVVKLPAAQAAALVAAEEAIVFEPSPGRRMREWVMVEMPATPTDRTVWRRLMVDARRYGAELTAPRV